jgi:hypothetical protein
MNSNFKFLQYSDTLINNILFDNEIEFSTEFIRNLYYEFARIEDTFHFLEIEVGYSLSINMELLYLHFFDKEGILYTCQVFADGSFNIIRSLLKNVEDMEEDIDIIEIGKYAIDNSISLDHNNLMNYFRNYRNIVSLGQFFNLYDTTLEF